MPALAASAQLVSANTAEKMMPRSGRPKYVFFAPWPVKPGTGVNNVILGLSNAMGPYFEPIISITGWIPPAPGQLWLKLRPPEGSFRSMLAFGARLFPTLIKLRRLVRGAVAANVHYPGLESLPLVILRRARLCPKLILSVHGSDVEDMLQSSGMTRRLYRFLLSNADIVVACSRALADNVRRISPEAQVVSIWNGTFPAPPSIAERPLQSRYILCVGTFTLRKGQDVLLDAFRRICDQQSDLRLVMIGAEGPDQRLISDLVHQLDLNSRVDMLVNVPQGLVWQWMRYAECLVLPSRREPFGICLLEAGLVHTPVVASRVGGIPEFIVHRIHGLLCDPERADCLASAILETLSDPVSARARADAFFEQVSGMTWDEALRAYCRAAGLS